MPEPTTTRRRPRWLLAAACLLGLHCADEVPPLFEAGAPAAPATMPAADGGAADAPADAPAADAPGDTRATPVDTRARDTLTITPASPDTASPPVTADTAPALTPDTAPQTFDTGVVAADAPADTALPPPPDAQPDRLPDTAPPDASTACSGLGNGMPCPDGHCCNGACVSNRSVNSCGTSCSPCTARANTFAGCDGTACTYACYAGFGDCDGNAANGCETGTVQSMQHCGGCNLACQPANASNGRCAGGTCTYEACTIGYRDCDNTSRNGCEARVSDAGGCP